uniref:Uncharacterized protein n=1 Tax=Manihot esculenta TaxID=3983 RepID=A0A2C9WDU0_MANES
MTFLSLPHIIGQRESLIHFLSLAATTTGNLNKDKKD